MPSTNPPNKSALDGLRRLITAKMIVAMYARDIALKGVANIHVPKRCKETVARNARTAFWLPRPPPLETAGFPDRAVDQVV